MFNAEYVSNKSIKEITKQIRFYSSHRLFKFKIKKESDYSYIFKNNIRLPIIANRLTLHQKSDGVHIKTKWKPNFSSFLFLNFTTIVWILHVIFVYVMLGKKFDFIEFLKVFICLFLVFVIGIGGVATVASVLIQKIKLSRFIKENLI